MILSALALGGCVEVLNLDRFSIEEDAGRDAATPFRDAATPDGCRPMVFYRDEDGDGAGDLDDAISACSAPAGYVASGDDCDDSSSSIGPSLEELCDGIDQNCDGTVDEGLTPRTPFYRDEDGDGAGDDSDSVEACAAPPGYVATGGDCAPSDGTVFPGAAETCDGNDQDCDTGIDEGLIGPVGTETVISSNFSATNGLARLAALSDTYAVVWVAAGSVHLGRVAPRGGVLSDVLVDGTSSTEWGPDVARVNVAGEERVIVAWQGNGGIQSRVYEGSGPALGPALTVGTTEGDQRAVRFAAAGGRVLAAWFSGSSLEARFVDPASGGPIGEEMSVSLASRTIYYGGISGAVSVTAPEIVPLSESPFRALVAFAAPTGGSPTQRGVVGTIGGLLNAEWHAASVTDITPFFETMWLFPSHAVPDGRVPVAVWGRNSDATVSGCATTITPSAPTTPLTVGECDPLMVAPLLSASRGAIMTLVETRPGRIGIRDIAVAEDATGGPFTEVVLTDGTPQAIAFRSPNQGMLLYTRGATSPYQLLAQPLGCE